MRLIIRADDLGMSDGVNCGIYKAVEDGLVSSVGLMPNMPEAKNGYMKIKDKHLCIGQHTNICLGKPLTNPKLIPSLVQVNGEFCSSQEIRARGEDRIVIEEAEIEIEAQLQRFIEITGQKPDYFEGHAVASPHFFQALENIAHKYNLFYVNPVDKKWAQEFQIECADFYHLNRHYEYNVKRYILEDEANILNKKCAVLVFHPGYLDQYVLEHSTFTTLRVQETAFLCSDEFKNYINEKKITIVDFINYKE